MILRSWVRSSSVELFSICVISKRYTGPVQNFNRPSCPTISNRDPLAQWPTLRVLILRSWVRRVGTSGFLQKSEKIGKIRKNRTWGSRADVGLDPRLHVGLHPGLHVGLHVRLHVGFVPAPPRHVDRVSEAVFLGFRIFQQLVRQLGSHPLCRSFCGFGRFLGFAGFFSPLAS